jgi:hypothetical protein
MATITDAGLTVVAKRLNGSGADAAFTYIATGSGSTAESTSHTALVAENTANGSARATATCTQENTGDSKWVKTFNFTGNVTVREIGIFNAPSGGTMFLRHVLASDREYENGQSLEITITNTTSRGA